MLTYDATIDYYEILDVPLKADTAEIKKAYRKQALTHHPDRGGDQEKFKALAGAYEILMDDDTHADYDQKRLRLSSNIKSKASLSPEHSAMIFSASDAPQAPSLSATQLIAHFIHHTMNSGIKAEDMAPEELFNVAMSNEAIAFAIAKDIPLLRRLSRTHFQKLALKYKTFAYQLLTDINTRSFFYNTLFIPYDLVSLLKNNYDLLLLISSSETLTHLVFFPYDNPFLKSIDLHEIYYHHLKQGYSGQAFLILLENSPKLKALFIHHIAIQEKNHTPPVKELSNLNFIELSKLAQKHTGVAMLVINNKGLLNKFSTFENKLIDILNCQSQALIAYFKSPRRHYFKNNFHIAQGCIKNKTFLREIINSEKEKPYLNGYQLNQIIITHPETLSEIKKNPLLMSRYNHYQNLIKFLTTNDNTHNATLSSDISILPETNDIELLAVTQQLRHTINPKTLATNLLQIFETTAQPSAHILFMFCELSIEFFEEFYKKQTFKKPLYKNTFKLCQKYFSVCKILLEDPAALSMLTNEQIYDLHQKWITSHHQEMVDLFNQNEPLMNCWIKGRELKKIQQSAIIADYQKQSFIHEESDALTKTRSLVNRLDEQLALRNIFIPIDTSDFITWLFEQTKENPSLQTLTHVDFLLPGIFWFIIFLNQPKQLTDELPLDFIQEKLEQKIEMLKQLKTANDDNFLYEINTHSLFSSQQQETAWFKRLLDNRYHNEKNTLFIKHFLDKNKEKCLTLITTAWHEGNETLALALFSFMYQGSNVSCLNTPLTDWVEYSKDYSEAIVPQLIIVAGIISLTASLGLFILAQPMIIPVLLLTFAIGTIAYGGYQLHQAYENPYYKTSTITYRQALETDNLSLFFVDKPKHPLENIEQLEVDKHIQLSF